MGTLHTDFGMAHAAMIWLVRNGINLSDSIRKINKLLNNQPSPNDPFLMFFCWKFLLKYGSTNIT